MRPKKTILLGCADADLRELLQFKLELWGYRVTGCGLGALDAALLSADFDLVLVRRCQPALFSPAQAEALNRVQDERGRAMRIFDQSNFVAEIYACVFLYIPRGAGSEAVLRDAIATAVARKRGPRRPPIVAPRIEPAAERATESKVA